MKLFYIFIFAARIRKIPRFKTVYIKNFKLTYDACLPYFELYKKFIQEIQNLKLRITGKYRVFIIVVMQI